MTNSKRDFYSDSLYLPFHSSISTDDNEYFAIKNTIYVNKVFELEKNFGSIIYNACKIKKNVKSKKIIKIIGHL